MTHRDTIPGAACQSADGDQEIAGNVGQTLQALRLRDEMFPDTFRDPRWYMVVDLYRAQIAGRSVSVSSLCIASGVAGATALSHITWLEREGWLYREEDGQDRRRFWIRLTAAASIALRRYFADLVARDPTPRALIALVDHMLTALRPTVAQLEQMQNG